MSVRQILSALVEAGHEVNILGATIFDAPKGISFFGDHWKRLASRDSGEFIAVNDGLLRHDLMKTDSLNRDDLTAQEQHTWFSRYQLELKYFKPDFLFFYGGGVGGFIPREAKAWGVPSGAYLVNGSFHDRRWCRDVDIFITDTQSTRDLYRTRLNIDPIPIGKFIERDRIASKLSQKIYCLSIRV